MRRTIVRWIALAAIAGAALMILSGPHGQHCQTEYGHGPGQAAHYAVICR